MSQVHYWKRPFSAVLPYWPSVLLIIVALFATGCGNGRPTTITVTGTVTYRGKPVEAANVMFIPQGSRPATGSTDAKGQFTLLSFKPGDGAVVGEHVVCIAKAIPDPRDNGNSLYYHKTISVLPDRYAKSEQSPLKANVTKSGPNDFRFDLTD